MKGIQIHRFGGPEELTYQDLPDPKPGEGQVLIRVKGASLNFADVKACAGHYHLGKKPPFIPGIDAAGIVLETGPGVKSVRPGDRVIAFPFSGSYAQKTLARENLVFRIPPSLDYESAAACPVVLGAATHMLLYAARVQKKESLLIHAAAGGVGSTAVQIASSMGLFPIIGSIGSPWKERQVRDLGAHEVIDYGSLDYAKKVMEQTQGKGVDVILNSLGGRTILEDLNCLAPCGRIILFGGLLGRAETFPAHSLHEANQSLIGFSFGHLRRFRPEQVKKTMETALGLLEEGGIEIRAEKTFSLEEAFQAHSDIRDRKVFGKIVLVPE